MKKWLRNPRTNAVGLSAFSLFYAVVFWLADPGGAGYTALPFAMLAATAMTVCLLIVRKRAYDEYHTELLIQCLVIALLLTMLAIAAFFLIVLADPTGITGKFMLFIAVHWVTVVLADLTYVVITRWR